MNRRTSIRHIILISSGVTLLPSCDFETFRVYENLPLKKDQFRLIRQLQQTILPIKNTLTKSTETPFDFVLTRLNDCYAMEDLKKYLKGLADFQKYLSEKYDTSFENLDSNKKMEAITFADNAKESSVAMSFFIKTNKSLTVEHFTKSEDFLKNHLDFEFVPGRYLGCVNI